MQELMGHCAHDPTDCLALMRRIKGKGKAQAVSLRQRIGSAAIDHSFGGMQQTHVKVFNRYRLAHVSGQCRLVHTHKSFGERGCGVAAKA